MAESNPYQPQQQPQPPQSPVPPPPGYGYPQPPQQQWGQGVPPPPYGWQQSAPAAPGTLLTLGDIAVTEGGILTPAGQLPLRGATWTATDMSRTEEKIPAHAIVLAIIFFLFCLLGLLFLLMKERKTTGFVQVGVNSGGRYHSTMIPVNSPDQVMFVMNQVNYARSLSA